jgi:DNA-binding NarL/FixJ family response regulator
MIRGDGSSPSSSDLPYPGPPTACRAGAHEVVGLLAAGLTNAEIAGRLVLSERTVHRHVANILDKLGARSRAAAAVTPAERGLL